MNPIRILVAVAVVVALAVTGFLLYRDPEETVIVRGESEQRQTGDSVPIPAPQVGTDQAVSDPSNDRANDRADSPSAGEPAPSVPAAERREPRIAVVEPREPEPRAPEPREPKAPAAKARPVEESRVARATPGATGSRAQEVETAAPDPEPREPKAPAAKARPVEESRVARATPGATTSRAREVEPAAPGPGPVPPSFDVVRVERSGEAVLAGRAAPNSRVSILVDGRVIGEVRADERGQWVFIPDQKLAPGSHEFRLESTSDGGRVVHAENVVVVSVPRPRVAAAAPAPRPSPIKQPPPDRSRADPPASDQPASEQAAPNRQAFNQPASNQPAPKQPAPKQPATDQPAPIREVAGAAAGPATSAESVPEIRSPQEGERPLVVLMPSSGQGPSRILQDAESPLEGLGRETLVLETVDYDADGNAVIGGRADPGARLIAYLDAEASGDAVASAQGRWLVNLEKAIAVGLHQLRVDQVDGTGKVIARIETPFSRVAAVSVPAGETTVIVQPGNSLWRIARRVYGRGVRFSVIYRANKDQIRDPDLIYPGQIFVVPGRG